MRLETTLCLPRRGGLVYADGQGRVIGLLVHLGFEPLWVAIIHLDHPGVVVRFDGLPIYTLKADRPVSSPHFVTFPPPT
jgi:hypothetical protein